MTHKTTSQTRSRWLLGVSLCTVLGACGNKNKPSAPEGTSSNASATAVAAQSDAFEGLDVVANLLDSVHLADLDEEGLYVDFGTPAQAKYVTGGWKTGWSKPIEEGSGAAKVTFARTGGAGRVYFTADGPGALWLRVRARASSERKLHPYLNGRDVGAIKIPAGAAFADYDLAIPEGIVKAGENQLLLRFPDIASDAVNVVGADFDSLRIAKAAFGPTFTPPVYASLLSDVTAEDRKRRSLRLRGGATLTYYVEVPKGGKLGVGASATGPGAKLAVTATEEQGAPSVLFDKPLTGGWTDLVADTSAVVEKVVRLQLACQAPATTTCVVGLLSWMKPHEPDPARLSPVKNVIVLLIDTQRADSFKAYNPRSRVRSVNFDAIAADATLFESAQTPENWTKPSVASLMLGLFPESHGVKELNSKMPSSATMVSELFKQGGFTTALFSANGHVSREFGFDQGWDFYTNYIKENRPTEAETVLKEAGDWIEQNKGKRFFTYIQTVDPHVPYDPPADILALYDALPYEGPIRPRSTGEQLEEIKADRLVLTQRDRDRLRALYDGDVHYHDRELGKFVERLKALGVWEQTLLIVTSDHGEELNEHGSYGHGHTVYQELLHVPLLVRAPGLAKGLRVATTVHTLDISPTVLQLAGLAGLPGHEGHSLVPLMLGNTRAIPGVAFSDHRFDRKAIVAGRWKLILKGTNVAFYDLQTDPREQAEVGMSRLPIASRYCRIMLGQFLGTANRGRWNEAAPPPSTSDVTVETTVIDEATRAKLKALGYAN